MNLDWKVVANEPWIWISGAILAGIALYQCTYFIIRALRIMSRSGRPLSDLVRLMSEESSETSGRAV